jgi:hypothetical protein
LVGESTHLRGIAIDDDATPTNGQGLYYDSAVPEWKFGHSTHTHAGASQGGTIASTSISDWAEAVQDTVGALIADGTTIDWTYTDSTNTASLEVIDNTITLAKLEHGTIGDVLYYTTSGAPARLGAGTAGQALITGGAGANPAWGAVAESKVTFADTGGHSHTGATATGTKILWGSIDKATSSIADITTKSHTALSDIGTNTHAQVDTFISTTVPAYFNTSSGHDHDGSDSKKVTYTDLASIPSTFAPSAHGTSAHSGEIGAASQVAAGTFPTGTFNFTDAQNLHCSGIHPVADSTTAVQIFKANGSTSILTVDTTNSRVGIGCTPLSVFHLVGGETGSAYTAATVALGYGTTGTHRHYIHTRHDGGTVAKNSIDFYTCDTTSNGVFPTNAVHGLTIQNGYVGVNTVEPAKRLESLDTSSAQLRLTYTAATVYTDFTTDSSGYLLIAPSGAILRFTGTLAQTGARVTQSYHTNLTSTNAVTVDSDERWKESISDTYGLNLVDAIPARSFKWREDSGRADGVRHHGFVAQEVRDKLEAVGIAHQDLPIVKHDTEHDEYGLVTGELIPILWTAVQELSAKVAALEAA